MITHCANAILQCSHPANSDDPPSQVSKHWAGHFLEQDPEYLLQKQRVQEIDQKNAQNPDIIQGWLQKFKTICDEYEILPQDIQL